MWWRGRRWGRAAGVLVAVLVACDPAPAAVVPEPIDVPGQPPSGANERVLIAAGDIACPPQEEATATTCRQAATARLVGRAGGEDLIGVLLLGDTQYWSGRDAEYASFDATWGAAIERADVPVLPATGNHEYTNPDAAPAWCELRDDVQHACGFERYFGRAPFTGAATDGHGSFVRVFEPRATHPLVVVVLDVGRCEIDPGACARGGPVPRFLTAVLADPEVNPPQACTVVAWHQARWSEYGHGDLAYVDPVWRALFVRGPATPDLVLNGHDHLYARMPPLRIDGEPDPGGIPQLIAGAGGREVLGLPFAGDPPGRTAFADTGRFGVLRLGWEPERGGLTTVFVTEDGDRVDPQRFTCR